MAYRLRHLLTKDIYERITPQIWYARMQLGLSSLGSEQILLKAQGQDGPADASHFRQIIGSLIYLVIGARPDIAFAVSAFSQFASKPTKGNMGNSTLS